MAEEITTAEDEETATAPETPDASRAHSDEVLGDAGKKALQEERRKARTAEKQLSELQKRLQEFEDRDKTEAQKLTERAAAAEKSAADAQTELMRYRVAADKKLPAELAARLRGGTPEEMAADADELLALLDAQQQRQTPNYDGGVRQTARPTSMNDLIRQTAGRG
ncbi:hypothetical protein ABZY36_35345 [Streptomyces sp. NPDC006627]|uniref:hypothetical protein n=1 Tax=Streptomyces sp. NPDC006627 TaxID=3154679 RepID=UPI00339F213A